MKKLFFFHYLFILALGLAFFVPGQPVRAAPTAVCEAAAPGAHCHYVSPTGSNSNPGTFEQPWQTPNYAFNHAYAPGDFLYLRGGNYGADMNVGWKTPMHGEAGKLITVKAYPGETATLTRMFIANNHSYIQVSGFNILGGFQDDWQELGVPDMPAMKVDQPGVVLPGGDKTTAQQKYLSVYTLMDTRMLGQWTAGIKVSNGNHIYIRDNHISYHTVGINIEGNLTYLYIENNQFDHCRNGIDGRPDGSWGGGDFYTDTFISGNTFSQILDGSVFLTSSRRVKVEHNTSMYVGAEHYAGYYSVYDSQYQHNVGVGGGYYCGLRGPGGCSGIHLNLMGSGNVVDGNYIAYQWEEPILVSPSWRTSNGMMVLDGNGVSIDNEHAGVRFTNNVLYRNVNGINATYSENIVIVNNTAVESGYGYDSSVPDVAIGAGIRIYQGNSADPLDYIANNVLYHDYRSGIYFSYPGAGSTADYNLHVPSSGVPIFKTVGSAYYTVTDLRNATTFGDHDLQSANPTSIFVNNSAFAGADTGDFTGFHLASASPALNAGLLAANTPAIDIDSHTRPQGSAVDIGADEYLASVTCYNLTWSVNPSTGGNVTFSPARNCNNGTQYTEGTIVTLTPVPFTGYSFSYWSGSLSGSTSPATLTMDSNKMVIANFVDTVAPTSAVNALAVIQNSTSFMVNWLGSDNSGGSGVYCYNLQVRSSINSAWSTLISCTTSSSSTFAGLAGVTYYFRTQARDVTGNWESYPTSPDYDTYTTIAVFNKLSPANGATGQPTNVTLGWEASGGATGYQYCYDTTNDNVCSGNWLNAGASASVTISGLASGVTYYWQVRAQNAGGATEASGGWWSFTTANLQCYTLTKTASPSTWGSVNASPTPNCNSGTQYTSGTVVTLTATPNTGFGFNNWSGDLSGSASPASLTMNANKSVTAYFVDTQAPTGSFVINGGAAYANSLTVNLSLPASDNVAVTQMQLSYNNTTQPMEAYASSKTVTFTGSGVQSASARYYDAAGNPSPSYSDNLLVDIAAPSSAVNSLAATQGSSSFMVSWSGSDNAGGSGVSCYDVQYRLGANGSWTNWQNCTTQTSAMFTGSSGNTYYFRSQAYDRAGNPEDYPTSPDYDAYTTIQGASSLHFSLDPATQSVNLGDNACLDVRIANVVNLGSFQFTLSFPAARLQATSVVPGIFLGSTGRSVSPVGPQIDNQAGTLTFGAYTTGSQPGPSGSGVLAWLCFRTVSAGSAAVTFTATQATDTGGTAFTGITSSGATITIGQYHWADVNYDGKVDVVDIQIVASHWNAHQGDANYEARFDRDADGDIDILDVQQFAMQWGWPSTASPNTASPERIQAPEGTPTLTFKLPETVLFFSPGETREIPVLIQGDVNLSSFELHIRFDPSQVQVLSVRLSDLLSSSGRTVVPVGPEIDNTNGKLHFGAATYGSASGVEGEGILAWITVKVVGQGTGDFNLYDSLATDSHGEPFGCEEIDSRYVIGDQRNIYLPLVMR